MSQRKIVGLSGNITRPSKTKTFVDLVAAQLAIAIGASLSTFDIDDFGSSLAGAKRLSDLDPHAERIIEALLAADALVIGSPTYKGSYTGLFKHVFDLLDPTSLRGKPIILVATGGGERHSLIVEHQLRPLFGFFEALTLPTAIYASDKDFLDGVLTSEAIRLRSHQAVNEARRILGHAAKADLAA